MKRDLKELKETSDLVSSQILTQPSFVLILYPFFKLKAGEKGDRGSLGPIGLKGSDGPEGMIGVPGEVFFQN